MRVRANTITLCPNCHWVVTERARLQDGLGVETLTSSPAVLCSIVGLYLINAYVLTALRRHRAGDAGNVRGLRGQGARGPRDRWRHLRLFCCLPGARAVALEALRAAGGAHAPQGGSPQAARGAPAF